MKTIEIKVEGMSCQHCVAAIENSVGKLSGVEKVQVDLGKGTATVSYNEGSVAQAAIEKEIEEQGYDVVSSS
ncbi:copper chaperone CopZ [Alkalihalobacillus oceani]|uniref:copper chaperone CopZ n=1 Tax=Halalkalibacter oceani TaxID=1653776 RepID=UPI002040AB6B|nr:copper chaperone CopZ [Halalkalibacter oceani]